MRSASTPTDALSRPPPARLFIVLTETEAAAILRAKPSPARTAALAKIRYALTHVTAPPTVVPPTRPTPADVGPSIAYRISQRVLAAPRSSDVVVRPAPNPTHRRCVAVDPQAQRHIRPTTRAARSSSSPSKAPIGLPPETQAPSPELDDSSELTPMTQLGLGWGKGRRVVLTIPVRPRPHKLRMAKAFLRVARCA
jgi:hypothetical protein